MKRFSLVLGLALLMSLALVGAAAAQSGPVTVTLAAQNGSGVSGTATLTPMGNQTQVVVNVTGEPAGGSEPEHIHSGTCATLDGIKYPLANVVNGTATTVVNVSLSTLTAGTFAVNLHESAANISHYIACGNITAGANAAAPTTSTAQTPTAAPATGAGGLVSGQASLPLAIVLGAGLVGAGLVGRRREA